jgi:outer membrane protein assembly factor BamE (lipoprotein component of BamABCDE complex)
MGNTTRSGLIVTALFSLTACTTYSPTPFWEIKESAFASLKPGISTKADVRSQVGIPLEEGVYPRQGTETWDYRYIEGSTVRMLAHVYFDSNGIYKYTWQRLDPAYTGGQSIK